MITNAVVINNSRQLCQVEVRQSSHVARPCDKLRCEPLRNTDSLKHFTYPIRVFSSSSKISFDLQCPFEFKIRTPRSFLNLKFCRKSCQVCTIVSCLPSARKYYNIFHQVPTFSISHLNLETADNSFRLNELVFCYLPCATLWLVFMWFVFCWAKKRIKHGL